MGDIFSQTVLGIQNPKLVCKWFELIKGNNIVKQTHSDLSKISKKINFYGFVEGNDINKGVVDVVVTDGFSEILH